MITLETKNSTNFGIVETALTSSIPHPIDNYWSKLFHVTCNVFMLWTLLTSPANIFTDQLSLGLNPHKLPEYPIHTMVSHLLIFEQEATFSGWNSSLSSLQFYLANSFSFRSLPRSNFLQEASSDIPWAVASFQSVLKFPLLQHISHCFAIFSLPLWPLPEQWVFWEHRLFVVTVSAHNDWHNVGIHNDLLKEKEFGEHQKLT